VTTRPHAAPVEIPAADLEISFVRGSGPGGQNVNKVASAAQLRFNLAATTLLGFAAKQRLARLAGQRLTAEGTIVIMARTHRTQEGNRREALMRLQTMIAQAMIEPKLRRPTRPTRASQKRRIEQKIGNQRRKQLRRRVRPED
jgi:ribosome-associated protein